MRYDNLKIKNAVFYAYHGVATDEQNLGGKFEVDAELNYDFSGAIASDNLKDTVNYETVYAVIHQVVTAKRYYLIETLANAIADGIMNSFSLVESVRVCVRKPHPPIKGVVDYIEVEIIRKRQ